MRLQVRELPIHEYTASILELLRLHEQETVLQHPCKPDWPQIFYLNSKQYYRFLGLFAGDQLVGYFAFFILPSIHTSKLVATHDILFVRKDWRIGRGALLLLKEADRLMQEAKVSEIFAGHQGIDKLGELMLHLGYKHVGEQYYKSLPAVD